MGSTFQALMQERFGTSFDEDMGTLAPVLERILSRRTHRSYAAQAVTESLLRTLIAAALSASSKSDYQQVSVLIVNDADKRRTIADLIPAMPWIGAAPAFLIFCADARRMRRVSELRGHPSANANLEAFFNASVDAALTMQTFILAAEAVGLGCCPISVIRNHLETICPLLELPPGVLPVAGLCVGYPAVRGHVSLRLSPAVTVHVDRYDDAALAAEIEAYDRRRDARHAIPPEKQRANQKYGTVAFYGWSEDKARQLADGEGNSFGAFVRKHGFNLD